MDVVIGVQSSINSLAALEVRSLNLVTICRSVLVGKLAQQERLSIPT